MADRRARIVVVGSINMDLVARVERLPRAGETVSSAGLSCIPGGKGANQAVALARLGAQCALIGRVGDDPFGRTLREGLIARGVDVGAVGETADCSSGVALIHVEQSGENAITISAGANGRLSPDDIHDHEALIAGADAVLAQLETPVETVIEAFRLARRHGVFTALDTAPAPTGGLAEALYDVDLLSPNQSEAEILTGWPVGNGDDAQRVADRLMARGARQVAVKMGALGACLVCGRGGTPVCSEAFPVEVVDTTAAGDAFTAALVLALAEGMAPGRALRFACAAGSLAVSVAGAQPAMPDRRQVEALAGA